MTLETRLWLAIAFGFGTAAFFSSVRGEVWFTAQIMGCTLHLLYLLAALDGRFPLRAGLALACGFATRTPLVFAAAYIGLELIAPALRANEWKQPFRKVLAFAGPCLAVGLTLLWVNWVRGKTQPNSATPISQRAPGHPFETTGLFHPHFSSGTSEWCAGLPTWVDESPFLRFSKHGISLFIGSPFLLWLLKRGNWNGKGWF